VPYSVILQQFTCEKQMKSRLSLCFVPLARHFVLIPVAFEIASSLLRALRDRRPVCVFEIYWATYCISPRVTSLLRSFRAANRYSHFRAACASLRAHTCCRR